MSAPASPWDALLRTPPLRRPGRAATEARPATKLAGLLGVLARADGVRTITLANECDMTPNQVWGLLKEPRACGQVLREDGRWSLAANFPGRDIQRAVDLLRSAGWRVTPPEVS